MRTETDKLRELAELLHERGVVVTRDLLSTRTAHERDAAMMWAITRSKASSCPAWLVHAIEKGKAVRLRGVCRDCGCTDDLACEGGCMWTDLAHTLCSSCVGGAR